MLVRPTMTAPAAFNRATTSESHRAGGACSSEAEPARVTPPSTSKLSLMETGIPANAPRVAPVEGSASAACACARAVFS